MGKGRSGASCAQARADWQAYIAEPDDVTYVNERDALLDPSLSEHEQLDRAVEYLASVDPSILQMDQEEQWAQADVLLGRLRFDRRMGRYQLNPRGYRSLDLPYGLQWPELKHAVEEAVQHVSFEYYHSLGTGLRLISSDEKTLTTSMLSKALERTLTLENISLVRNLEHNGFPDTLPGGVYRNDSVANGRNGIEIKASCVRDSDDKTPAPGNYGTFGAHTGREGYYLIVSYGYRKPTRGRPHAIEIDTLSLPYLREGLDFTAKPGLVENEGTSTKVSAKQAGQREIQSRWLYVRPGVIVAESKGDGRRRPLKARKVQPHEYEKANRRTRSKKHRENASSTKAPCSGSPCSNEA